MRIWCFDCFSGLKHNDSWGREVSRAALLRGHEAPQFKKPEQIDKEGYVFARRRQFPPLYEQDFSIGPLFLKRWLKGVQDYEQWTLYEDKVTQLWQYHKFMPRTDLITSILDAFLAANHLSYPIVSKSAFGSSSVNVRILNTYAEAQRELNLAFGEGIPAKRGQETVLQKGYLLWQEFVPHDVTWRVTAVGRRRHIYKRFCYPDKPVAAPSAIVQTEPAEMSEEVESLLAFSNEFFAFAKTKWCAIDVLKAPDGWKLLETSLAWARGNDPAGNAKFYGTDFSLNTQHDLLIREIEEGAFG